MPRRLCAVHIIAGLEAAHGGPSYSVPRLCEALAAAGAPAMLLSVGAMRGATDRGPADRRFPQDCAGIPMLRDLRLSSGLSRALRQAAIDADVVHNHGLWLMPNVAAGRAARRAEKPLVISPRGMLAPAALAFSRLKKRVFWSVLQGATVRRAACLHATSAAEYGEIRAFGLANPVAVIANGIDLPELPEPAIEPTTAGRTVLSLGRIHPKKGLDFLVRAWAEVEVAHPDWTLRIVGPAEDGHDEKLRGLAASLGLARVSVEGPLQGDAKNNAYRDADVFVLSSLNENFGLTVAEALAAGTPVISTKGAPWSGLETEGCGWWIDHGVEPLAKTLAQAMTMPREALKMMGRKGRAWMARDFSWDRVALDMLDVYRWLAGAAEAASTVRFD